MQRACGQDFDHGWAVSAAAARLFEKDMQLFRVSGLRANANAKRLEGRLRGCRNVRVSEPVETNAVFIRVPKGLADAVFTDRRLLVWDPGASSEGTGDVEIRLLATPFTREADIDQLINALENPTPAQPPA
jgi:threonine aldolase